MPLFGAPRPYSSACLMHSTSFIMDGKVNKIYSENSYLQPRHLELRVRMVHLARAHGEHNQDQDDGQPSAETSAHSPQPTWLGLCAYYCISCAIASRISYAKPCVVWQSTFSSVIMRISLLAIKISLQDPSNLMSYSVRYFSFEAFPPALDRG